ncbi:DeoR/GlpR family DNA-binding transcription regulator [Corynebacterium vitaeruminis]|uniref:DeoR/GlpR family DNA-binding transcription regulator n=1 Tax=Corynebacterium vitaeruminis TaxID=38305 RepID=UPI0006609E06|nr:DeoR/GlpR family DNA-binding transcription regulator [Corynebacterium vitaeruminis]
MYAEERRRKIASLTAVEGRVTVADLAEAFDVTAETIRRDLAQLDAEGAVHRVHGGAVATRSFQTVEFSVAARKNAQKDAKLSIARHAADFLPDSGGGIFLDAGTTTEALAELMVHSPDNRRWSVVTNSLPNAITLAGSNRIELQLLGGQVRVITQAVAGDTALRTLAVMRADVAFIGSNALTIDHGLSTADPQEAAVKRAMITNARKVIVMADSTKLGRDFLVSFAALEDIDVVITDSSAPEQFVNDLREHGVEVVVAS